jgi:hypothetical protein
MTQESIKDGMIRLFVMIEMKNTLERMKRNEHTKQRRTNDAEHGDQGHRPGASGYHS